MMKTSKIRILPLASCLLAISANAQVDTNLIGYWQFENDLTENVHAANLHDGTAQGTNPIAYAAGPDTDWGQALDLDGTNGVSINNSANTEGGYVGTFDADVNTANALTVSFWAKGAIGANWNPFLAKHGEGSEGWQVRRRYDMNAATFTVRSTASGNGDPIGSNTAATETGWRHFLAVWDGAAGTRKLYIDGVEDTTMTIASGDTSTGGPGNALDKFLTIGMRDAGAAVFGNNFTGQIDDVAIWSRPLTDLEAKHLATSPLSASIASDLDTDGDGLLDSLETTLGTSISLTDSDSDGVGDFEEVQVGSDPTADNDFDMDGLTNMQETTGSANPFGPSETTDWNNNDSDGDGILDGEEVIAGVDTFVTNPNDTDTDGDGWTDSVEIGASPQSDPTSAASVPTITTNLIGYWDFENDLVEKSGAHAVGLHDGIAVDLSDAPVTPAYIASHATAFGQALDLNNGNAAGASYGIKVANSRDDEAAYATTFDAEINTANAMSISFWSNGDLGRWGPIICKFGEDDPNNGVGGWQVRKQNKTAVLALTLRNTNGADDPGGSNSAAASTVWKHVVAVWDGNTRKIYIDGVEEVLVVSGDTSTGGPGDALDKFLTFGMRDNGYAAGFGGLSNAYNGDIDDVAIWSRALLPSEINLLAGNPLSLVITNVDSDGDGLFDDDEINGTNGFVTDHLDADSDDDGVNDKDEGDVGSDPNADNDFDMDGLTNLQETSGSANPWTGTTLGTNPPAGDTTAWDNADSDLDGVNDGDEISITNGSVTNPNDPDTDDDGFTDGAEVAASSDPADDQEALLNEWQRGLIGYWQFEDDLTNSGHLDVDGAMGGDELTPVYLPGKFGQAIDLDKANNQRVEVGGDENYFDTVGSDMTVSIWVKADALTEQWQGIIAKGEQSWRVARRATTTGAAFAAGTNGDAPALDATADTAPINDSQWHHIVGVAEFGVATRIYVDGYLVEERPALPNVADVTNRVWIGANPDTVRSWDGSIDDAAVWKRVLTPEEVYTVFSHSSDVQDLIDNDVAPVTVIPDPEPAVIVVETSGFDGVDFKVTVSGLDSTKSYELWTTESLDPALVDWFDIDGPITGVTTYTFTDLDPRSYGLTASFYKVVEVVAP